MGTRLPDTQVRWPAGGARPDAAWCRALTARMLEASRAEPKRLSRWLPSTVLSQILVACTGLLAAEETLVELHPPAECRVTVVGDTHGQLHDVVHLLSPSVAGEPSSDHWVVFNGDLVDRGAWGVETLALACAWKLALPGQVTLLRGNHESEFCTFAYGFANELQAKFTAGKGRELHSRALRLFSVMPLAARLGKTLVLHGGLFRHPPMPQGKRKRASVLTGGAAMSQSATESSMSLPQGAAEPCLPLSSLGTLAVLRDASRGGADPDGEGVNRVASDVLWCVCQMRRPKGIPAATCSLLPGRSLSPQQVRPRSRQRLGLQRGPRHRPPVWP
jgi:serine/threonine-protein phosphatase 5